MKNPDCIVAQWKKEQAEKIVHAERMIREYRENGNSAACEWWSKKLNELKLNKY